MHDYAQNSPPSLVETNFLLTQVPSYCFHRGILIISAALGICPQFNKCIFTKMKVGCLRHPGASTTGSQLLEKNPGNPAMSPHKVRGTGTCHTVETVERGRESGWEGNCLGDELLLQNRHKTASCMYTMLWSTSTWNSNTSAYVSTPLTTWGIQALLVA